MTENEKREMLVGQERESKLGFWEELVESYGNPPMGVPPKLLNEKRAFFGGRGIWRDADRTRSLSEDDAGVVVGVLHTGQHYADDLTDSEILYHYPDTKRKGTDRAEIQSLKNAHELGIPLFVVCKPTPSSKVRNVNLGWVDCWDDKQAQFLINFVGPPTDTHMEREQDDSPFCPTDDSVPTTAHSTSTRRNRPNQKKFQLLVFKRYGARCALTGIDDPVLLDAAHLHPKTENGKDHPRNGLPLSPTVHRALDEGLIAIDPETMEIISGGSESIFAKLGIKHRDLSHLPRSPAKEALGSLWSKFLARQG